MVKNTIGNWLKKAGKEKLVLFGIAVDV